MRTAVIIPSIDRLSSLHRCLDSLEAMTTRPDEIIVVLQGAEDPAVSADLRRRHPGVTVSWIERRGASVARNAGCAAAVGDLLLFVDDDCVVHPTWLQCYRAAFAREPRLAAAGGQVRPLGGRDPHAVELGLSLGARPRLFERRTNPVGSIDRGGNLAIRRGAFLALGGFDEGLGPGTPLRSAEDTDLVYRLMRAGLRLRYLPQAVVDHDQWRTRQQARAAERGYGVGLGGFLIKHIVRGDVYAAGLAFRIAVHLGIRPLLDGLLHLRTDRCRSGARYLVNIPLGMVRGLTEHFRRSPALESPES